MKTLQRILIASSLIFSINIYPANANAITDSSGRPIFNILYKNSISRVVLSNAQITLLTEIKPLSTVCLSYNLHALIRQKGIRNEVEDFLSSFNTDKFRFLLFKVDSNNSTSWSKKLCSCADCRGGARIFAFNMDAARKKIWDLIFYRNSIYEVRTIINNDGFPSHALVIPTHTQETLLDISSTAEDIQYAIENTPIDLNPIGYFLGFPIDAVNYYLRNVRNWNQLEISEKICYMSYYTIDHLSPLKNRFIYLLSFGILKEAKDEYIDEFFTLTTFYDSASDKFDDEIIPRIKNGSNTAQEILRELALSNT